MLARPPQAGRRSAPPATARRRCVSFRLSELSGVGHRVVILHVTILDGCLKEDWDGYLRKIPLGSCFDWRISGRSFCYCARRSVLFDIRPARLALRRATGI